VKRPLGLSLLMMGIFVSAANAASVTVNYAALPATPAPSTIMLTALGLLITFIAFRKLRHLPVGRPLAAILLLAGLSLFEAITRQQLITKASAIAVPTESLTGGGTLTFTLAAGAEAFVQNNTGATQQITSVSVPLPDALVTPFTSPQCQVGTVLTPGAGCYVELAALVVG
jgi:hypothetical protein